MIQGRVLCRSFNRSTCPTVITRKTDPNQPSEIETHDDIYEVNESFFEGLNIPRSDAPTGSGPALDPRSVRISYPAPKVAGSAPMEII